MKKLLITANSRIFAETLTESLSEQFEISVCYDGMEALQLLRQLRPDLLALELMLPGVDGVGVLKTAQSIGIFPRVIAYSAYISDYVTASLEQMNVCSLIRLPCNMNHLAARILEMAAWQEQRLDLDTQLRSLLAVLGFKINHAGCVITEMCVKQYLQNPKQALCSQLYPAVAQQLGATEKSVERAMGRAIESAWSNRDEQIWCMYFPVGKNGRVVKPSNAQFMARIADCLTQWVEPEIERQIG